MNFDGLLGRLIPLFEQKLAFSMELANREMSLREKTEERKVDLEYRKLEAQITNDKDKLKWEKEKLTTAVKGDYDLQVLKNSGMLDQKRLEGLDAKEKQKIMEEGANARAKLSAGTDMRKAKLSADTENNKAYLATLGTILGHAVEKTGEDANGKPYSTKPTAEVGTAARSLMEQTGLARPAATPQARNVAGEAEFAVQVLRGHEKAGTKDAARSYLNALPADTRQAALALLNPGNAATPAPGVSPVTPAAQPQAVPVVPSVVPPVALTGEARTPISAAVPSANAVSPVRPYVEPTYEGSYGTLPSSSPVPVTPAASSPAAPSFLDRYKAKGDQYLQDAKKAKEEEEKNRALRRARGLTVGGSF